MFIQSSTKIVRIVYSTIKMVASCGMSNNSCKPIKRQRRPLPTKILFRTVIDIYISDLKDVMAAKAEIQVLYFISHENLPFIKYKCMKTLH